MYSGEGRSTRSVLVVSGGDFLKRILLKNAHIFMEDGKIAVGNIAILNDKIEKITTGDFTGKADQIIDCTDRLAVPGFVNTHTHVSMTLLRSYADDMNLMDWLQNKIWPIEAKMNSEDIYWGAMLGIAEMIKGGTTAFVDMYAEMHRVAQAVEESGIRAVLTRGMIGAAPNGQQALEESKKLFTDYHNTADGRITVMLAPHAPYTCPPAFLRQVVTVAQEFKAQIHIHLSETAGEVETCYKEYGKSPIALMEETGILECGVLAAHCVHLSQEDMDLLCKYRVRVAHNPGSNMKLASGIAPIPALLKAGIVVGLGTDGTSSNNNLDMLEEIRLAALLHKANTLDPLVIPTMTALEMATKYGALAAGYDHIGVLKEGYKADITLFDMRHAEWYPRHDLASLLVYAANSSHVDTVLVDGRILLENGRLTTLDEERICYEANRRAMRLIHQ